MSNEFIVKFRPFDKVECCFDIFAVSGNNVEATFDFVAVLATMFNEFFMKFRPFDKVETK